MLRIPLPEYADGTLALLGKCALAQSAKALQMRESAKRRDKETEGTTGRARYGTHRTHTTHATQYALTKRGNALTRHTCFARSAVSLSRTE